MTESKQGKVRKKRIVKRVKSNSRAKVNSSQRKESVSQKKEIKGLIVVVIALIGLLGLFGGSVGLGGNILTELFEYGFGYGSIVPCLSLLWIGIRQIYIGKWFTITKRGIVWCATYFLILALITMVKVSSGSELIATHAINSGGFIGGLIAAFLHSIVGDIGSIIVTITLLLCCGLVISRMSLSKGLHHAKDKTQVGIETVREVATEKAGTVRMQISDWQEQRKAMHKTRKAYNREEDTRFLKTTEAIGQTKDEQSVHGVSANNPETSSLPVEDSKEVLSNNHTLVSKVAGITAHALSTAATAIGNYANTDITSENCISKDEHSDNHIHNAVEVNALDSTNSSSSTVGDKVDSTSIPPGEISIGGTESVVEEQETKKVVPELEITNLDAKKSLSPTTIEEEISDSKKNIISNSLDEFDKNDATTGKAIGEHLPNNHEAARRVAQMVTASSIGTCITDDVSANTANTNHLTVPSSEGAKEDTAAVAVETDGIARVRSLEPYRFPRLDMLAKGTVNEVDNEEVAHNAEVLETTLKSFGITARVANATKGPAVTRYELEPAPGTKVSKIVNLTDDIKLSLAAADIRMEAPIPGKSAIGIEVPNRKISAVHLRDVLDCDDFSHASGGIPVGLGKDIAGTPIITDLAKMPHLLVAGSTGSGKSVCINTLIASILFSRKPEEVKLILIDPKMVELSTYNGIPHLMLPVVTDMKKAAAALRWAVREMEARYRTFAATGVRDIKRYNELHPKTAMPLIVIIIDELADLMMTAPADIEESISRLAQMARAAGLHMVLATQRPSVNVITGTIKANVPSRISFAVATQIDSRTILDMAGAEKLLGKGDMLFAPIGANKPVRIQGCFISDDEVEQLVDFVKEQGSPSYDETIVEDEEDDSKEDSKLKDDMQDELFERAVNLVLDSGQASVSMLQRRFRIGYSRAARLVDTMEELKIVGPNNGSKARDILMSKEEVIATYFSQHTKE